jgi:diguanylate cyclase
MNRQQKEFLTVLGTLYVLFIAWFALIYLTGTTTDSVNLYSNAYGIIPLLSGLYGLSLAHRWGGLKSSVGKAMSFLSLGLITWGIGMAIWLYYNLILNVEIPYPSLADAAFILSWPLWGIGAVFLSTATGAKFGARGKGMAMLFAIPLAVIASSYYFLVTVARQGIISTYEDGFKTFFDLAYPVGDVVILSIALLIIGLSYKYFGGMYKAAIYLILAAFVVNYFADFTFSYMTSLGTYYNGSLADILFATTMFVFGAGIALLDPRTAPNRSMTEGNEHPFEKAGQNSI